MDSITKPWLFGLSLLLMSFIASGDPFSIDNLTEVNQKNNTQCVDYYVYQGKLYCDSKRNTAPALDPQTKNYEQLKIVFDDRPWLMAWGNKNAIGTTMEYIPAGGDINHWQELITSQYFPGLQKKTSLEQFANTMIKNIRDLGYDPKVTYHEKSENRVIFEMQIAQPQNQVQDELQMLIQDSSGIYVLHYVIKEKDMGEAKRNLWLQNLKNSGKFP